MKSRYLGGVLAALIAVVACSAVSQAQSQTPAKTKAPAGAPAPSPAPTDNPPAKAAATQNVGVVYFTPYRVKFSDGMYIGIFCVLADGQTPTDIASVLGAMGTLAGTIATGATATLLKAALPNLQTAFAPIIQAIALKPGQAYCYHVKFKDAKTQDITFAYPLTTPAKQGPVAMATNSYMQRYTAAGVNNSTFAKNSNDDTLHIEYPDCGANSCPCRGQFCQVRSFGPLSTDDPIVAASVCVEAPADAPTESFIVSFGAPEKITDATKRPIPTDDPPLLGPDFVTVGAVAKSCTQRGFLPH